MKKGINCELCINPDFWAEHTDDEQIALLTHELMHICLQHMFISESFANPRLFNVAADMEANSYIENLPEGAVLATKFGLPNAKGTKFYYEALSKPQQQQNQQQNKPCNGGQGGSSDGNGNSNNNQDKQEDKKEESQQYPDNFKNAKPMDDHGTWKQFRNIPEATKQLMQNTVNNLLKSTAEQIEKQCGSIPGELTELITKLREKKPEIFNWKQYFRRLLGSIYDINIKSTRRKQSKRFEGAAGIQHKKKVSILVAVDTSGSVSTKELQDFFSEIDYIYKARARVTILECDTRINKIEEYDGKHLPAIVGRGGTSFDPPVEYYVKHKKEYASLIYFTDGECHLPNKHPSGMVWVITSNGYHQDYPGKTIYIPKEHGGENK
jgi:predicted metal-dependent peptidase